MRKPCLILWGAEMWLRAAVIILRGRVEVTVMMMMVVVVVLWRGVVVVMVTLDVPVGKEQRGGGRWRLRGRCDTRRQRPVALDGAVPTGCTQLGGGGQKAGPVTPAIDASGQIIIAIIASRVVKEISSGAEAVAVDHSSWSQVLVGSLDSEENHDQAGRQQLPEEQDDPKHNVGFTADLLHIGLIRNTVPAVVEGTGLVLGGQGHDH